MNPNWNQQGYSSQYYNPNQQNYQQQQYYQQQQGQVPPNMHQHQQYQQNMYPQQQQQPQQYYNQQQQHFQQQQYYQQQQQHQYHSQHQQHINQQQYYTQYQQQQQPQPQQQQQQYQPQTQQNQQQFNTYQTYQDPQSQTQTQNNDTFNETTKNTNDNVTTLNDESDDGNTNQNKPQSNNTNDQQSTNKKKKKRRKKKKNTNTNDNQIKSISETPKKEDKKVIKTIKKEKTPKNEINNDDNTNIEKIEKKNIDNNDNNSKNGSIKKKSSNNDEQIDEIKEEKIVKKGSKKKKIKAHDKREHLNLVLIGHVDAGKSTISGQILLQTGQIDERTIDKYKKEAKDKNRESWWIAYIMDEDNEERAKGKTVECGRAHFTTNSKRYTILDAPGHKNYVPNMIQGATQADVALLVISARKNEFEAGFTRGGQTREHALLAYTLGISRIIVIINKIDCCRDAQTRYNDIQKKISKFLNDIGFKSKYVDFLPLSGQNGLNIIDLKNDEKGILKWYKGKSLVNTLDDMKKLKRNNNNPLRIPILDKYKGDKGVMIIGKVESGGISVNDCIKIEPCGREVKIVTLEIDDVTVNNAKSGENILIGIGNGQISMDQIFSGSVISSIELSVPVSSIFKAQIYLNELPNKSIMTKGYSAMFHCHNISCLCEIIEIPHKINKKNGKRSKISPPFLRAHDSAIAIIKLENNFPLESYDKCPQLGRFTLRDSGKTVIIGKIEQVMFENDNKK